MAMAMARARARVRAGARACSTTARDRLGAFSWSAFGICQRISGHPVEFCASASSTTLQSPRQNLGSQSATENVQLFSVLKFDYRADCTEAGARSAFRVQFVITLQK